MSKYIIQKSSTQPNGWVLSDTENLIVIRFEDGKFNETQNVVILDDSKLQALPRGVMATEAAKIMQTMGDWAARHHGSKLFDHPHGFEYSEDNEHFYFYRRKYPRLRIEFEDKNVQGKELKNALNKMAAFLMNNNIYNYDNSEHNRE